MDDVHLDEPVSMPRGAVLRIEGGAGVLVCVWSGEVWLTEQDSASDHVLVAGQSVRLHCAGTALAHAFRRAQIGLSSGGESLAASRITLIPPGGRPPALVYRRETVLAAVLRRLARLWRSFSARAAAMS